MKIYILDRFHNWPEDQKITFPCIALQQNNWDDYGYQTSFNASVWLTDNIEDQSTIGLVKIGKFGLSAFDESMRKILKNTIVELSEEYFSLGQSVEYYRKLDALPALIQRRYAGAMRDIPMLRLSRQDLEDEEVFRVSLLRSSAALEALDTFGRKMAETDVFRFRTKLADAIDEHEIQFNFAPENSLPHRVNVLVGLNGVGKTQLMARLAVLLSRFEDSEKAKNRTSAGESFEVLGILEPRPSIYSVIAVSFSAFDDFELPKKKDIQDFHYSYCGLRNVDGSITDEDELAKRIPRAVRRMNEKQKELLISALKLIMPNSATKSTMQLNKATYRQLSAGQRIVLNIVCELITNIRKRSLILFDEPETHLHPQLLSNLLAIINDLLEPFDSFAVIATHSPIVVQQVLANRVHIVRRLEGNQPVVSKPPIETFGENLTEIVRTVFDAVESDRDYQDVIDRLLEENNGNVSTVEALFENNLGLNAQIYLHSRGHAE